MVTGYLDYICSGIANYCEIYRKNIFGESVSWSCPSHVPTLMTYEQSQLQPKSLYCNQSWKNSITYAKYMQKICVRIGMCYLCTIHIIDAYSSTTRKNASPSMYIGGLYIGGLGEGGRLE